MPLEDPVQSPCVVISLDFELRWGMHDKLGLDVDAYRSNLENARSIIVPALLTMFRSRNIRVTWAMVGALGCSDWEEFFQRAPSPPGYRNQHLAINPKYAEIDPDGRLHFAPELMTQIAQTPGQDLGSHTFTHLFLREPGVTAADAAADAQAVNSLFLQKLGRIPYSLVFPRNQSTYETTLRQNGIRIWRGNERLWYYQANDEKTNTALPRCLRLLDALNPFAMSAHPLSGNMTRASQFVRFSLPNAAWKLHMTRFSQNLMRMKPGHIFHIWWHPHNLGQDVGKRLTRAEQMLDAIGDRVARGQLVSRNMADLVQ